MRNFIQRVGVASIAALSVAAAGCSVGVADLGNIARDPEGCIQEPARRGEIRDALIALEKIQAHGSQKTVVSLIRRQTNLLQGRAIFLPTGAASLGPRTLRLRRDGEALGMDGLRCELVSGSADLNVFARIPRALPPDTRDGGPYSIDFWSDLSRNGTREPFEDDHSWSANVCDNGRFLFEHNRGFENLADPTSMGGLRTSVNPSRLIARSLTCAPQCRIAPNTQACLDEVMLPMCRAEIDRLSAFILTSPLVITVERQGITVGYLRTELECHTPDASGEIALAIPGIGEGGAFAEVQFYFDTQRNGRFDMDCDPSMRFTEQEQAGFLDITGTDIVGAAFSIPSNSLQNAPGQACAVVAAPTRSEFLSDCSGVTCPAGSECSAGQCVRLPAP